MSDIVKDFLSKVEKIKKDKFQSNILSKELSVECDPITFKQQKDIMATMTDGILGPLKFQKVLNDIIMENTGINDILVTDKLLLILEFRKNSTGSIIKVRDKEYDVLEDIIDNVSKLDYPKSKVINDSITLELTIPTLEYENKIITSCIDHVKKTNEKDLGKHISDIYTFEIVKFIKSLDVGGLSINFQDISVKDRVNIVDNLPLGINKQIIEFIQKYKEQENAALEFNIESDAYHLDIDVSFFDS